VVAAVLMAGCQSGSPTPQRGAVAARWTSATVRPPVAASSARPPLASAAPPRSSPAPTPSTPTPWPPATPLRLPDGGMSIVPRLRVVAFYGGPDGPGLGVLGTGTPEQAAAAVAAQAAAFAGFGRAVQPAMELLASVAQDAPGPEGTYSRPVTDTQIAAYLAVAHAHRMLLILDIQPGGGEFLPQVQALQPFLLDPDVSVALDPEWKVPPGQAPGNGRIGSSSAASINTVAAYLSGLITAHRLPDELLIIHQFTTPMLPDRDQITTHPGVEQTLHADGEGTPAGKVAVYHQLAFPTRFHTGFKLFYTQDTHLMSPGEVMALTPRPDIITYQ